MRYPKVQQAIEWAAQLHAREEREGDDPMPYITHPVEVLLLLRQIGDVTDEDMLCAAVLHDTVEAGWTSHQDVEMRFGQRVSDLVRELTREEPSQEQARGLDADSLWNLRSKMLMAEIARMSRDAMQIKLADRLANLIDARRTKSKPKLKRYIKQSKEILKSIPEQVNASLWRAVRTEIDLN